VLLDTNQLVSSLLSTRGPQRELIDAWRRRAFVLALALGQIEEVGEVLSRPKIRKKYPVAPGDREEFLTLLRREALLLPHAAAPGVCRDLDDDYLLGCAAAGSADYLVTGNENLLALGRYRDVVILGAREFLAIVPS
jgi:putative PIN family toxin of toxin-antitoxin system